MLFRSLFAATRRIGLRPPVPAGAASAQGTTFIDDRKIVHATVEELLAAVRDLLRDEEARASSLNARGSGLTGFVGVILSVSAAVGVALTGSAGTDLDHWVRTLVSGLVASALGFLVAALITVVCGVLLPANGDAISTDEAQRYSTWEFISREHVMVQGHLLRGYAKTLKADRTRNNRKARYLKASYILVTAGLALVALAGATAIVDAYVGGNGRAGHGTSAGLIRQL